MDWAIIGGMYRSILFCLLIVSLSAAPTAQDQLYHDPGMQKIVQVAIVCKDIDASAKRWANLLGVEVPKIVTTRPGKEVNVTYYGKPSNGRAKLAFFKMGQVSLELIEPVGENTSWKHVLDANGEGVHHLGFQVVDLEKTAETLQKLGMKEEHRGRYDSNNGTYVYFDSRKPLGTTVELLHSDK